ncbi:MAG: RNA polymerase sigma factor SigJ [Solirubrobacteraceae bacterium]
MSDLPPTVPDSPAADHVTVFEEARPRLVGLAYRITGSLVDAEDVVSEVWLRWAEADHEALARPQAWLATVTVRRAIDWARARVRRRETYLGPWLPEPVVTDWPADADPEVAAELADSLSLGFLTVLDRLDPVARAVFLLADIWGWSFAEVAAAVGRSATACRQLASRARRRAYGHPRRYQAPGGPLTGRWWTGLVAVLAAGDIETTLDLLAPDVVLVSDGWSTTHAARHPVVTAERVANFLLNLARRLPPAGVAVDSVIVNGTPGIVVHAPSNPEVVMACEVQDGRVVRIWTVLAPEKLRRVGDPPTMR